MTHEQSDTGTQRTLQNKLTGGISPNKPRFALNMTQKSPGTVVQSPDKRGLTGAGLGMIQSKGLITVTDATNQRSKASITNFASSLREDDLMISSSQVDPKEQSGQPASRLGSTKGSRAKAN